MLNIELLQDRGIVAVSGDDSRSFLQGLITNDIAKVSDKQAIFACLLSPQGKFLYDFFIIESQGNLLIETEKSIIPELIKRLSFYKLRAKVEIKELPNLQVGWIENKNIPHPNTLQEGEGTSVIFTDPRSNELGMRIIAEDLTSSGDESTYDSTRIKLCIAEGSKDLTANRSLPIEFAYDKINAIDFNKGCYVGQEVTARSKHRATLHKFIHFIEAKTDLPAKDTAIFDQAGKEVGYSLSSQGNIGLAIINIEAAKTAELLKADEIEIKAKIII